jgi:hypothetical protein
LAARVAQRLGGRVRRFFHQQAEPSKAPGLPIFENLTLGFEVLSADGARLAAFVDDLTLQRDLDRSAAAKLGWYRIVADDARILRLVDRHCDAAAPLERVLDPLAALFGSPPQPQASGMVRIVDDEGRSVAIAAPLPGERERPCEIVTAPIERDHAAELEALLADARALGFTAPIEGATHIHFDASPLLSAPIVATLVDVLQRHGDALKAALGANPNCVRLGRWPEALPELTRSDAFRALAWPQAQAALKAVGLSKFCDYNLLNIAAANRAKHTFEVRVLPTHLNAEPIIEAAQLFEGILRACCAKDRARFAGYQTLPELLAALPVEKALAERFADAAGARGAL